MIGREAVYFDPETVILLRETLDDAWACLSPELQATMQKTALAERILKSAARGERDQKRLLACCCAGPCRLSGLLGWRRKRKVQAAG